MSGNKVVLVGASPRDDAALHPGGQRTASIGLSAYAKKRGYDLEIIDTAQSSFPVPPLRQRLIKGGVRIVLLVRLLRAGGVTGVILFASTGLSVIERVCMSALCRAFRVPDVLFVRSGHFMNRAHSSAWTRLWARVLLKVPFRIGAQGRRWIEFYRSLGVEEGKIVLIRNWLPPSVSMPSTPKTAQLTRPVHFIFVGWVVREKGVNELIEAIRILRPYHRLRCSIVGGGTLEGSLRRDMEERGWARDVVVLGWKTKAEVEVLLEEADVFVLPSYAEGFPNALLEAMAKGLPAICSNVGAIPDSLIDDESGFLVPPRSPEALADAMRNYLENPLLINKHSEGALRSLRENHDWESNCQKLFDIFELAAEQ